MKYRRVLLVTELDRVAGGVVSTIRRVAPAAEFILVIACAPKRNFAWFSGAAPGELHESVTASVDALRQSMAGAAKNVEITLAAALDAASVAEIAAASDIDLLACEWTLPMSGIAAIAEVRKRRS